MRSQSLISRSPTGTAMPNGLTSIGGHQCLLAEGVRDARCRLVASGTTPIGTMAITLRHSHPTRQAASDASRGKLAGRPAFWATQPAVDQPSASATLAAEPEISPGRMS